MEPAIVRKKTEKVLVYLFMEVSHVTLFLVSFRPTALSRHHDKRTKLVALRTASPYRT